MTNHWSISKIHTTRYVIKKSNKIRILQGLSRIILNYFLDLLGHPAVYKTKVVDKEDEHCIWDDNFCENNYVCHFPRFSIIY